MLSVSSVQFVQLFSTTIGFNIRRFYYSCEAVVCTKFVQRHRSYYGMNMHTYAYDLVLCDNSCMTSMVLWDVNIKHLRPRFPKPCG